LPALLGMCYTFNQADNHVNPKAIKWMFLEGVLKNIAILHQTGQNLNLSHFIYQSRLNDKEQFEWLQLPIEKQFEIVHNSKEAAELTNVQREKIFQKTLNDMENVVLPANHMQIIKDLLEWSYSLNPTLT
jgi:hypothetical protein